MKRNVIRLILLLAIPLGVGVAATLLSGGMDLYSQIRQPPLSPPGWVFPVVWTILYVLMGYCSYLIVIHDAPGVDKFRALCLYGVQLAIHFAWPLFFFRYRLFLSAFFVLILLWLAVLVTWRMFDSISRRAGNLWLAYLLWVTFAGYLNYGVFLLN